MLLTQWICPILGLCFFSSEESAFRVLCNKKPDGSEVAGIPIIVAAYEQHKDNAEVVEAIATVIMELTEYGMYQ